MCANRDGPTESRRILIVGLSSQAGGRLAQALERDGRVAAIIGVDTADPRHELDRTEYVRVDTHQALLRRIIRAAAIDTVVDARRGGELARDGTQVSPAPDVIATRNVLMACADSPVRKLVFKSSANYYGCGPRDPAFFTEEMQPAREPRSGVELATIQGEEAVRAFAARNPDVTVTVLRVAGGIGGELESSHLALFSLPLVPSIFGFDPRHQFIHEDDIVGVLEHAIRHDLPGIYNAAADGVLALSEISSLLGKPLLPMLPPWGTEFAAVQLKRIGLRIPLELLGQLRYGRGLDNRRLKAAGYSYRYTSREAVLKLRAHQRLRPLLERGAEPYHYEREVEEFLRWSPSVHEARSLGPGPTAGAPASGYDELGADELIELIASMEPDALVRLRDYEAAHGARREVLDALERRLARRRP